MRGVRRFFDRIPRRLRVAVDLTLAAALLLALYVAAGCPAFGEENEFRRAEKAGMMGPSEIMDWVAVQRGWPSVGYDRVLIGDDGDAILFYTYTTGRGTSSLEGRLLRREKTEGLLLTPLPCGSVNFWQSTEVLPLFLFADDPDAVRAEVLLRLTWGGNGDADGGSQSFRRGRKQPARILLLPASRDGGQPGGTGIPDELCFHLRRLRRGFSRRDPAL